MTAAAPTPCRGDWRLGTACGKCAKCAASPHRPKPKAARSLSAWEAADVESATTGRVPMCM